MTTFGKSLIVGALLSAGFALSASAADMTGAAAGDARTKVATAVALANIATSEKDGEALLVAARMLATAGPVAKAGEAVTDGKPTLYDVAAHGGDGQGNGRRRGQGRRGRQDGGCPDRPARATATGITAAIPTTTASGSTPAIDLDCRAARRPVVTAGFHAFHHSPALAREAAR